MVLKQALSMACICGQPIEFPGGQVKAKCGCGTDWELGPEGFWSALAPILSKPKTKKCKPKNHYERYMAWRNENRGKKGGSKMLKKVAKSVRRVLRDLKPKKLDTQPIAGKEELLVDYLDTRNVGQRPVTPNFVRPFGMRGRKW